MESDIAVCINNNNNVKNEMTSFYDKKQIKNEQLTAKFGIDWPLRKYCYHTYEKQDDKMSWGILSYI